MAEPVIRNVSDTARWTAAFRARETDRPDALFRDPLARKLAGERGENLVRVIELGAKARRAVIVSEGLLIYLKPEDAADLARDLAEQKTFRRWIFDLASPGLMEMMRKRMGAELERANAPLIFGPAEGPAFFEKY